MASSNATSTAAQRRRARRAEIVRATRELFDARGLRDANIDDISRAVGVNRAIIYRHFSSKDELFALTLADYLDELDDLFVDVDDRSASFAVRLRRVSETLVDYGLQHPAFLDCTFALMRQSGDELLAEINEGAQFRLGQLLAAALGRIAAVLRDGQSAGQVVDEDADLLGTLLFLQVMGGLHLARTGFYVSGSASGPRTTQVDVERVRRAVVVSAVAAVSHGPSRSAP